MTIRIEGVPTPPPHGWTLDKRFYVPGVTLWSPCPVCGSESALDLDGDYLSHPDVGEPYDVNFWCEGGDSEEAHEPEEWTDQVVVGITLTSPGFEGITEDEKALALKLTGDPLDPPDNPRDQFLYGAYAENRRIRGRIERGETGENFPHSVEVQAITVNNISAKPKMPSGTTLAQAIEEHWIEKDIKDFTADQLWTAVKAVQEAIEGEPDGDD